MRKGNKRRSLSAAGLMLAVCLLLAGCGADSEDSGKNAVQETQDTGPTEQPAEQETPKAEEEQPVREINPQLQEFIELVSSFSDVPELEGAALEAYFEQEYDSWMAGTGYANISLDGSGHLQIEDHSAEYVGEWWDINSRGCSLDVACSDGVYYHIDINWGNASGDNIHWAFIGTYDRNRQGIVYQGSKTEEHYPQDGELQTNCIYTDGEGLILIKEDGSLYWEDARENAGAGCVFRKN